jgi:3-phosphoshikimate 1-carboxyvinyltransferase
MEAWPDPWPAPYAPDPVDAVVSVPGSKSLTNRALILGALADGPSLVRAPLRSRDTDLMAAGLRSMGVGVDETPAGDWAITPGALTGEVSVDVGNAGTVMRFLPPVACLADGPVRFDGDPRSRERPLGPVVEALRQLGADIEASDRGGMPVTIHGMGGLPGGEVAIDASASSQFVSALLLSAPRFEHGIVVRHVGEPVPSLPHIEMTVDVLRAAGVSVDDSEPNTWRVAPGTVRARDVTVEPDLSNAAPFLAAAMVTGGTVTVAGWPERTTQPGGRLPQLFEAMGGSATRTDDGLVLRGPDEGVAGLVGVDADLHEVGELAPVLAAVAALAPEPSQFSGIAHLRAHETDRLAALVLELARVGLRVLETSDGLTFAPVDPGSWRGAKVQTYDDHRLATAAAVLGLVIPGVQVVDVATTAKTMPDFPDRWLTMLGEAAPHARMGIP